jgi:capsid portal protein
VLGVSQADFVNYDLFQSSGIPALAILVSGGRLTSESWEDIANILDGMKGVENWNKIAILEALGVDDTGEVDDKPTNAKVDFKELPRPSDAEFQNYVKQGEKRIQSCFKLPPLLSGEAEEYSRSTSDSSKLVAESEVFSPERKEFDEVINFTIMKSLDAKYHRFESLGPQLMQAETQIDALGKLARAGALTVNDGVRIANRVLDLDKPLFDSEWSQIPVALLLELIKKERVTEIENVGMTPEQAEVLGKAEKALESDEIKKDIDQLGDNVDGIVDQLDQLYSLLMRTD